MSLTQIVSGGQTGVDRAALDAALRLGIDCGGWCPLGRLAEDAPLPERYPLCETPARLYRERTEWNARDSDGTLILTWGPPADGTAFTVGMAKKHSKPCLIIDLSTNEGNPEDVERWMFENGIEVLNVAGPRESKVPGIYLAASSFLDTLLDHLK